MRRIHKKWMIALLSTALVLTSGALVTTISNIDTTAEEQSATYSYFEMEYGGQVGLSTKYSGIRFRANVSEDWYEEKTADGSTVTLGMIIAPYKFFVNEENGEFDIETLNYENALGKGAYRMVNQIPVEFVDGEYTYTCGIFYNDIVDDFNASYPDSGKQKEEIKAAAYKMELCARGYARIYNPATKQYTVEYADYNYNSRSPRQVANAALANGDIDKLPSDLYDDDWKGIMNKTLTEYLLDNDVTKTETTPAILDLSENDSITATVNGVSKDNVKEVLVGAQRVTATLVDVAGGMQVTIGTQAGLPEGEQYVTVIAKDDEVYRTKIICASKIITTADELASLHRYTKVKTNVNARGVYYSYGGYFVLGNDIKTDGRVLSAPSIGTISSGNQMSANYGFHGTFDGQGYTVDGFSYSTGGVFGDIGNNAVIKNVGFTNCTVGVGSTRTDGIGVLSANARGNYTISDVYVQGSIWGSNGGMLLGRSLNGGTFRNVVVDMMVADGGAGTGDDSYIIGALASWDAGSGESCENVSIIYSSTTDNGIRQSKIIGNYYNYANNGIKEYQRQKDGTLRQIMEKTNEDVTGESTDSVGRLILKSTAPTTEFSKYSLTPYWTLQTGYAPRFKSSVEGDRTRVDLTGDATFQIEASKKETIASQLSFLSGMTVTAVYDESAAEKISVNGATGEENGFLNEIDTSTALEDARTKILLVEAEDNQGNQFEYRIKVLVVTKIITTAEQLAALNTYKRIEKYGTADNLYKYGGYFVLGNSIHGTTTFSAPSLGSINSGGDMSGDYGFHGTFDGQGYTINGFTYGVGGVFGDIGNNAVIKNVGFSNCTVGTSSTTAGVGVLCANARGTFTVSNVYVQGTLCGNNGGMLLGRSVYGGTLEYIVVDMAIKDTQSTQTSYAVGGIASWAVSQPQFTRVIVVCDTTTAGVRESKIMGNTPVQTFATDISNSQIARLYQKQADGTVKQITKTTKAATGNNNNVGEITTAQNIATINDFYGFSILEDWAVTIGYAPRYNEYTENNVKLIDLTGNYVFDLEARAEEEDRDSLAEQLIFALSVEAGKLTSITTVYDGTNEVSLDNLSYLTGIDESATNESSRQKTLLVKATSYGNEVVYRIKVRVVSKIITTAEQLKKLINYGTNKTAITSNQNSVQTYSYDGYFVLGGNINASNSVKIEGSGVGKVENNEPCYNINSWNYVQTTESVRGLMGFHGTFDGRGYTIDGFTYGIGGVFGGIGTGAVIKNVAFTNCVADADGVDNTRNGGVLAQFAVGTATDKWTLENVYVQGAMDSVGGGMLTGRYAEHGVMNNVVVRMKSESGYNNAALSSVASGNVSFNNVALVYDTTGERSCSDAMLYAENPTDKYTGVSEYVLQTDGKVKKVAAKTATSDNKHVASLTPGVVATKEDFAAFNSTYWMVKAGYAPTFIEYTADGVEVIDYTSKGTFDVESTSGETLSQQLFTDLISLNAISSITKIYDVNDWATDIRESVGEAGDYLSTVEKNAKSESDRYKTLIVCGKDFMGRQLAYRINVLVATKVITMAEELADLQGYSNDAGLRTDITNSEGKESYSYGGYFVLGNDITNISNITFSATSVGSISSQVQMSADYGFHGTFDGRGYTVDGFSYGVGGVFGDIGNNAVIKNVAFTNCTVGTSSTIGGVGVLSANAWGSYTISNVYVQGTLCGKNSGMLLGRSVRGGTLENIVVDMTIKDNDGDVSYNVGGITSWNTNVNNTPKFNNVVIVCDDSTEGQRESKIIGSFPVEMEQGTVIPTYDGARLYQKQADGTVKQITETQKAETKNNNVEITATGNTATANDFNAFSSKYWMVQAGYAPIFKTRN